MKTKLLTLALLALSASAQTFTCVGCTDFGLIAGTPYTMQYGAKMVWTANVEPGAYVVDLTFVEPLYTTKGSRPINVWVNGVQLLGAFDVIASVKQFAPITWRTQAMESGGKIVVALTANDTGSGTSIAKHNAILSAISAVKIPSAGGATITRYVGLKLAQISDGTWAPVAPIAGRLIAGTLQVTRNGILQDETDYSFDGSNNSVRLRGPFDADDKLTLSVDTQQ